MSAIEGVGAASASQGIVRVDRWSADELEAVSYFVMAFSDLALLTDYVNGGAVEEVGPSLRARLELAALDMPQTERSTLDEVPYPLREYLAAIVVRQAGTEVLPTVVFREQMR